MEAATAATRHKLVMVTLTLTDDTGHSTTEEKSIEGGPTEVLELKAELGVAADIALWVVQKNGKKKQLGDHEKHNVKDGDHYEALVRGGVS
jgi:hypothetical protein